MVTGDEEIKYGYLLDPCFQIVNTAGKPLTSGWIEVYIAGTRNKYYCSSDFAGTLHPFKIPLDSLGSNIILADVEKSYDVYVYNKFGSLIMSRYNITPGKGGAGGSISGSGIAEHWIGKNGENRSIPAGTDTPLKLPAIFEYEGSFIDHINENRTAFYLREGLYLVQAVVNFKQSDQSLTNEISQVDVFTRSDDAPEDMSFNRDMAGPDSSDDSHCLKVSFIRCVKEDDAVSQIILFKVNTPNAWSECYLQNVQIAKLSSGGAGAGGRIYYAGEYISIDEETNVISVTGIEPESYATHDEVEQSIASATSAFITSADIPPLPDDLVTSAELAQTSGLIEQDIADLTSAVSDSLADKMDKSSSADFYPMATNPSGYLTSIPSEYVTDSEMSGYVAQETSAFITSADLPSEEEVQFEEIDLSEYAKVSAIPDVSDMATMTWVANQNYITSADIPPQIEYSAGENIDISGHVISVASASNLYMGDNFALTTSGDDYYLALSGVNQLVAGNYISITSANDTYEISCTGLQPAGNYVDSAYVSSYVDSAVSGKQDSLTFSYDASDKINAINGSALAGEAQVNSDWDAVSGVAEILNKPDEEEVQFEELNTSSFVDSAYVSSYVASQTSGKQDTLTFGYNGQGYINAINNSAIAGGGGGGGHEYSGTNGITVDNLNETIGLDTSASNAVQSVIENSGAWGGAGLPISAGTGINVALENGTLVISNDETVLFENSSGSSSSITPSESLFNFQYVDFYISSVSSNDTEIMPVSYRVNVVSGISAVGFGGAYFDGSNVRASQFGLSIGDTLSFLSHATGGYSNKIYKVVGINRVSGGN